MTAPNAPAFVVGPQGRGINRITIVPDATITGRRLYRDPRNLTSITAAHATGLFTKTAHGMVAGDVIAFGAIDYASTASSPLTILRPYYVIASGLTADAFKVSATPGGSTVTFDKDITSAAGVTYVFLQSSTADILKDVVTPGTSYVYTMAAGNADGWCATLSTAVPHTAGSARQMAEKASSTATFLISSDRSKKADFYVDGVHDEIEINEAIAALGTYGGTVKLAEGEIFYFDGTVAFTDNKRIVFDCQGTLIVPSANVTAILVNQGTTTTRGVVLKGTRIDGGNLASNIGIEFRDTNWSYAEQVQVDNCGRGILMHSYAANKFVEGISLTDIVVRMASNSVYGIELRRTGGTNSFAQHNWRGVNINVGAGGASSAIGLYIPTTVSVYRSRLEVGVWIGSNQTGFSFDGDFDNTVMDLFVEGASASTGNTAVTIGTNATHLERARVHLSTWGTIATIVSNAFSKDYRFQSGPAVGVSTLRMLAGPRTYTNLPSAVTESSGSDRIIADCTGFTWARIMASVTIAFNTGNIKGQYSTDNVNFFDLTTGLTATTTGVRVSAPMLIPSGAKAPVIVRIVGYGGDAAEDPVVNGVSIELH